MTFRHFLRKWKLSIHTHIRLFTFNFFISVNFIDTEEKVRISKLFYLQTKKTKTKLHGLSPQANYTDRLSDRRLSAKLVPTSADRGCRVVSATIPPQSLISVF
jgi:hypothetical protein